MYEEVSYESILKRMLDRVPSNVDKREGSVIYDALAPAAVELQLMYIELDVILRETFADTASRENLIKRAAERGLTPTSATYAVLLGEFIPTTVDVTGKRFNIDEMNYIVTKQIEPGQYQVRCEAAGSVGNKYLGQMIPMEYIAGLETAVLTEVLVPGEDEEETEVFRQRYFDSFKEQAFGGNRADYIKKVNSIPGVGSSKIIRAWNGASTVKVVILDSEYNPASDVLIDTVQTLLDPAQSGDGDGLAPIDHIVSVATTQGMPVNIATSIEFNGGYTYEDLKSQIEAAISDYLLELRKCWDSEDELIIRISQIESRILSIHGINDIGSTTINGIADNLVVESECVPVMGGFANG